MRDRRFVIKLSFILSGLWAGGLEESDPRDIWNLFAEKTRPQARQVLRCCSVREGPFLRGFHAISRTKRRGEKGWTRQAAPCDDISNEKWRGRRRRRCPPDAAERPCHATYELRRTCETKSSVRPEQREPRQGVGRNPTRERRTSRSVVTWRHHHGEIRLRRAGTSRQ